MPPSHAGVGTKELSNAVVLIVVAVWEENLAGVLVYSLGVGVTWHTQGYNQLWV